MIRWQAVLLSLIVPPVGVVMVLFRAYPAHSSFLGKSLRTLGRLLLAGVLMILMLFYLVRLGLLHAEMSDDGLIPNVWLRNPNEVPVRPSDAKADEAALEKHRAAMLAAVPRASPGAPSPEPAATVPVAAPAGKAGTAGPPVQPIPAPPPWSDFRGGGRDGVYREGPINTTWPAAGLTPLWKQPIGGGWASFAIAGGHAFTIEQRRDKEMVVAYDVPTGRELWTYGWPARFSETYGGDGPRATPVWHDGLLYALGATGELHVLDAAMGKRIWTKNILNENGAENIEWGMANAPLIVDEKVIVTPGGKSGKSVVAYHKKTGERIWASLDDEASYSSPMLVTLAGMPQIILMTGTRVVGIRTDNGSLLWDYPWRPPGGLHSVNSAQPIVVSPHQVFLSSAYDQGSALLEISANDKGLAARPVWKNKNLKNRFNSSVLLNGYLYGFDEGIFACIDARTGERKWKGGRYGYGQAILAGEHIIVLAESGELVLLKATPDVHQEVTRSPAIEGKTWNHPALAGGILLVRNAREMAAFRIAP